MKLTVDVTGMYNTGAELSEVLSHVTDTITKAYTDLAREDEKRKAQENMYYDAVGRVADGTYTADDLIVLQRRLNDTKRGVAEPKKEEKQVKKIAPNPSVLSEEETAAILKTLFGDLSF